jgi:hypothetical protein
MGAGQ